MKGRLGLRTWTLWGLTGVIALVAAPGCGGSDGSGEADAQVGSDTSNGSGAGDSAGAQDGGGHVGSGSLAEDWPQLDVDAIEASARVTPQQAQSGAACLSDALAAAGGQPVDAGHVVGPAGEGWWVALDGGSAVAAIAVCQDGACQCATAERDDGGHVTLSPVGGGSLPGPIGAPVLARTLKGADLGGDTELDRTAGALVEGDVVDLDPALYRGKRRFLVLNAWGPLFGVDFGPLVDLASKSGRFTKADEVAYADAATVEAALHEFHALDVLVWFGATVRHPKGSDRVKPEAMTVNRGILGEETFDRERIAAILDAAPLGGPGLLVLAGAESFGSTGVGLDPSLGKKNLVEASTRRPRVVVGFEGPVRAGDAVAAVGALVDGLLLDESLLEALARANARLAQRGSDAVMRSTLDGDPDLAAAWKLAPAPSEFWGKTNPAGAQFVAQVTFGSGTLCEPPGGGEATPMAERSLTFTVQQAEVDGPFIEGHVSTGSDTFDVFAVVGGLFAGAPVRFWLSGSRDNLRNLVLLGDGELCDAARCGASTPLPGAPAAGARYWFDGTVDGPAFELDTGETCLPPQMMPLHNKGGQRSWIELR